jgi:tetratricopeptide (TPR) repeat protein
MADNPSTAAVPAEAPAPPARRPARPQPRLPLAVGPVTNPSTAAAAAEALQQADPTPAGPAAAPGAPPTPQQALRQLNQTTMAMALRHHLAGRLRQAEPLYRAILRRTPQHSAALINLSALLRVSGRLPEAREIAERSVAANPNDPMTYFGLGAALRQMRRDRESIAAYEKAVELDPTLVKAWINLAVSTERLDRARSLEAQAKVLAVEPENLVALNLQLKFHLQDCDFDACEAVLKTLLKVFQRELASVTEWRILANMAYRALFVPVPLPLQRRITDRIDQLHQRSLTEFGRLPPLPPPDPSAAGRKIRLAYMTPNFADHPVGHVTLSLFPAHDRERFEIHAIATHGRRGGDPDYNKRHRHGVDYYHDLSDLPFFEMARRIRNLGIDILVDLDATWRRRARRSWSSVPARCRSTGWGMPAGSGSPSSIISWLTTSSCPQARSRSTRSRSYGSPSAITSPLTRRSPRRRQAAPNAVCRRTPSSSAPSTIRRSSTAPPSMPGCASWPRCRAACSGSRR